MSHLTKLTKILKLISHSNTVENIKEKQNEKCVSFIVYMTLFLKHEHANRLVLNSDAIVKLD